MPDAVCYWFTGMSNNRAALKTYNLCNMPPWCSSVHPHG